VLRPDVPAPVGRIVSAPLALIVLAAGHGTRMKSRLPKPLHPVAGLPMITHVLRAGAAVSPATTLVVVNPETAGLVGQFETPLPLTPVLQDPPRGTGDAVRLALAACPDAVHAVVLFADHPLLTPDTVETFVSGAIERRALVTVLTTERADAGNYGRIERDVDQRVVGIIERNDDRAEDRTGWVEINSGMMVLDAAWARAAVERLTPSPATGELYLTELVRLAIADHLGPDQPWPVEAIAASPEVALGINDRHELAIADYVAHARIRERLMRDGVSMIGPDTIFIDADVEIGPDTTIHPFTTIHGGTVIGRDCMIGPHATITASRLADGVTVRASTVTGAVIGAGSDVGPYAHLRPGTELGTGVHIGNFGELKNAKLADGVKSGHFSYLGDTTIGPETNIGAGTITANFDGVAKHRTAIGAAAFIGSDAILRAPVRIGDRAIVGAGSVVTRDVPADSVAVGVPARVIRSTAASRPDRDGAGGRAKDDPTEEG
jgi:bifunctional UDP-N-acetylglucosamine pyrophosphorylase/glucosamine-1-phosphate N-acetyltransferase